MSLFNPNLNRVGCIVNVVANESNESIGHDVREISRDSFAKDAHTRQFHQPLMVEPSSHFFQIIQNRPSTSFLTSICVSSAVPTRASNRYNSQNSLKAKLKFLTTDSNTMPRKGRSRKKNRTHVTNDNESSQNALSSAKEANKIPKSLVVRTAVYCIFYCRLLYDLKHYRLFAVELRKIVLI